jgi:hypothetical protein
MHSQLPRHHRTTTSHPRHRLYCQVIFPVRCHVSIRTASSVTIPRQHPNNHMSSVLPHVILSLGHVTCGLPRVIHTVPHDNSVLVQIIPKLPKLSDTCHLLMLPCVLTDVIMTSPDVSSMAC